MPKTSNIHKLAIQRLALALVLFSCSSNGIAPAQDAANRSPDVVAEQLFNRGEYLECLRIASEEMRRNLWNDRWPQLVIRCQLTIGKYADAKQTYEAAVRQFSYGSVPLRILGYQVYRCNGESKLADEQLTRISTMLNQSGTRFSSNDVLIAIGRYYLLSGEDPRKVLELLYDRIRKSDPKYAEVYVATAELALSKQDYKLAAESLKNAIELRPEDPYLEYLAAQAWLPSDSTQAQKHLQRALQLNSRHVPSLLLAVDRMIDAEKYVEAKELITEILAVNLAEPEAWAYHAVIAHLQGFPQAEQLFHAIAQERWRKNPQVEHLIGRKLAQHYRFREGAAYQKLALALDADYAPAQLQLAQDLLRLGKESEGWTLATAVNKKDAYNVEAHNLAELQKVIDGFTTLEQDGFLVRMDSREAKIYGQAVLKLLSEARSVLATKYEVQIDAPVVVEIFAKQKDFAIRTFGLPGGAGFLGVCFGRVITANSPASQGTTPSNWQSVLWHEFCHVITLEKTRNRMPRWLSEGISVYEERQRDPTWGQSMSAEYRQMLLGDAFTPLSQLSSAFMEPKSPLHLQFAYYESSLAIEFMVKEFGFEVIRATLRDLGVGIPMNQALERHCGPLAELDQRFDKYCHSLAMAYAPTADWKTPVQADPTEPPNWQAWLADHPGNVPALQAIAKELLKAGDFAGALEKFEKLSELVQNDSHVLEGLVAAYHGLGDTKNEEAALVALAAISPDALDAYQRLAELSIAVEKWDDVERYAQRMLAVNPLLPQVQQTASKAAEKLEHHEQAMSALQALAEMDPVDPAGLYYRLALVMEKLGQHQNAKRHVLKALEEAPRYREALGLLGRLVKPESVEPRN